MQTQHVEHAGMDVASDEMLTQAVHPPHEHHPSHSNEHLLWMLIYGALVIVILGLLVYKLFFSGAF